MAFVNGLISEQCYIKTFFKGTDHSSATDVGWVDARNFRKFGVMTCATALTGTGVSALTLQANTASDGSGTDITPLASRSSLTTADAAGDCLWIECDLDDTAAGGADGARYVNCVITAANAADDHVITYILSDPKYPAAGLTADIIS